MSGTRIGGTRISKARVGVGARPGTGIRMSAGLGNRLRTGG